MCSPGAVYAGVAVVSAITGAYSAYSAGKARKAAGAYNARVSENEAQETRNRANEAETAHRLKTARLLSKQKAQLGASGIDIGSGSALQLQEDTITLGEADALRIRRAGDSGFSSSMTQAELETAKGELAESQGMFSAAGSLLSGAAAVASSGVADKWFTADSVGKHPS